MILFIYTSNYLSVNVEMCAAI